MKFWYWSQSAMAVVLAVFVVLGLLTLTLNIEPFEYSIQFSINAWFFFPGEILSLGLNQILLYRRNPHSVSSAERILFATLYVLLGVLIATSIDSQALLLGLLLWPVIVVLSVANSIVIAITTARLKDQPQAAATPARSGGPQPPSPSAAS